MQYIEESGEVLEPGAVVDGSRWLVLCRGGTL